jgi:phosphoglycerate kinase
VGRLPVLEDLPPLEGKKVLLRVDFNVPLAEGPDGVRVVADDFRIRATLPTIEWLLAQGAEVTAHTHLGRPRGAPDERFDLAPVRARLAQLAPGVQLAENLRFDPGEEEADPAFVEQLVDGYDVYVNDAFGASHRAHASIVGPPAKLPSAAGRLLAREAEVLSGLLASPARPFVAIFGGAKVSDKLPLLASLADKVDELVIGGGMAYTFLAAARCQTGNSLVDRDCLDECEELLRTKSTLHLPVDSVALSPDGRIAIGSEAAGLAEAGERRARGRHQVPSMVRPSERGVGSTRIFGRDIPTGWSALDIGPATAEIFADLIASAATVLWNGPMGVFEDARFGNGTRAVADAVAQCKGFTVVGGGETAAALAHFGLAGSVDHLSTGGGASLELLRYGDLPGLRALRSSPGAPAEQAAGAGAEARP